jgi:riboflavin biosynthesis pyrimidine reductase
VGGVELGARSAFEKPGPRIHWHLDRERRHPFGDRSPDPEWFEPIGFPPPWPDRPWIYGVMVASANGVVAWRRAGADDDPVRAILGGDDGRPERIADRRHMRHLRCYGDVGIGSQTLRDQPRLVQSPQEPGEPPVPALYAFRVAHGLPHHPRAIVYSLRGGLAPDLAVFNTPGMDVFVIGPTIAEATLSVRGVRERGVRFIVEDVREAAGLRRAHQRLFSEASVRYLAHEGGETMLRALHAAGLLDEVFVTQTDAVIDQAQHDGVLKIFEFEREGAELIAEGKIDPASAWVFRRWRFRAR